MSHDYRASPARLPGDAHGNDQLDVFAVGNTPAEGVTAGPGRLATPRTGAGPALHLGTSEELRNEPSRRSPSGRVSPDWLSQARERGHQAGDRAAQKTERLDPGWVAEAVAALGAFAQAQAVPFIVEDARLAGATPPMPEGTDARAWGTVTRLAKRQGLIRPSGTYRAAATSNGSPKPEYVAGSRGR